MFAQILRKLAHLTRPGRFEEDFDAEIQFHLETRIENLEREGLGKEQAVAQARREFGSRARASEETRSAWNFAWIEQIAADVRFAFRSFTRRKTFAFASILCLAIGIAANALMFSLVNGVLLRKLPYPQAEQLTSVRFTPPNQSDQKLASNSGTYFFVRDHSDVFEKTGVIRITGFSASPDPTGETPPEWIQGAWTSTGMIAVMGVEPILGRWYSDDGTVDVVISHHLWKRMFHGAADVVGKRIFLDSQSNNIVGVAPEDFQTMNPDIDLWRSQPDSNLATALRSPNRPFFMFGRLKPGISVQEAQARLSALEPELGNELPMNRGWGIRIESLRDSYVGYLRRPLFVLQGAVFILLLIACANAAGLLLAQAATRQKEFALRVSLGSSRGRLIRQLLVENAVLSLTAGALGTIVAWFSLHAVLNTSFAASHDLRNVSLDWRVLAFTFVVSLGTGLVFGVLPAIQVSRPALMNAVRESGRSLTASASSSRLRGAFVVAQMALALVLLTGSGLLIRTLILLNTTDPGLNPRNVAVVQVPFGRTFYRNANRTNLTGAPTVEFDGRFDNLSERIRERLAQVPGVKQATAAVTPPLGSAPRRVQFSRPGVTLSESDQGIWSAEWYPVSTGYFETLEIPIRAGRAIDSNDRQKTQPVAMINEAMARQFFPNQDPIGQQVQLAVLDDFPRQIVGIAGDVRQDRYQTRPQAQVYVPRTQLPSFMDMSMSFEILVPSFVVRTVEDPGVVIPALRAALHEVAPALPVSSIRTVEDYAAGQLQDVQQYATLLSLFGGISVMLALTGIFGIMVSTVSQRTNEIGIRVALGATAGNVLKLVIGQGFKLIVIGLIAGLAVTLMATPAIGSFLWGVRANDPLTFALAAVGLAAIGLLACYVPALRALRVQPVEALRNE
ncbi:MAG TPA: ABC transporter permease [Bryobacteraceae bacterium]|jgi:predicted permease|nr:ABC transporter permease [Bryobacteraceae bacterium]